MSKAVKLLAVSGALAAGLVAVVLFLFFGPGSGGPTFAAADALYGQYLPPTDFELQAVRREGEECAIACGSGPSVVATFRSELPFAEQCELMRNSLEASFPDIPVYEERVETAVPPTACFQQRFVDDGRRANITASVSSDAAPRPVPSTIEIWFGADG